jgi:hypothetical protein
VRYAALLVLAACRFDPAGHGDDGDDVAPVIDADPDAPDAGGFDAEPPPDGEPVRPGTLVAVPAPPMTLDGEDTEFDAAGAQPIGFPIQDGEIYQTFSQSYQPSSELQARAMHDEDAIYVFIEVFDPTVMVDSADLWQDDAVAIYLDVLGDASGPLADDDHELTVRADGVYEDLPNGSAAVTGEVIETLGGFVMELRIAKGPLGAPVGTTLGFDLGVWDDDGWGNSDSDAWGLWFTSSRPACADCCAAEDRAQPWCDTTLYGTLRLD